MSCACFQMARNLIFTNHGVAFQCRSQSFGWIAFLKIPMISQIVLKAKPLFSFTFLKHTHTLSRRETHRFSAIQFFPSRQSFSHLLSCHHYLSTHLHPSRTHTHSLFISSTHPSIHPSIHPPTHTHPHSIHRHLCLRRALAAWHRALTQSVHRRRIDAFIERARERRAVTLWAATARYAMHRNKLCIYALIQ